jgi:hypothetical protein
VIPLVFGGLISAPFAGYLVKIVSTRLLMVMVGSLILLLSARTGHHRRRSWLREQRGRRSSAGSNMEQDKMTQRSRRRMLIKAVRDAAVELARRGGQYLPTPFPDEPVIMASRIDGVAEGPYLDNKRPTPDEIPRLHRRLYRSRCHRPR